MTPPRTDDRRIDDGYAEAVDDEWRREHDEALRRCREQWADEDAVRTPCVGCGYPTSLGRLCHYCELRVEPGVMPRIPILEDDEGCPF